MFRIANQLHGLEKTIATTLKEEIYASSYSNDKASAPLVQW